MYWVSNVINNQEPSILISYFHINPISKIIEIHTKEAKNQQEFEQYYEKVKSL